MSVTAGDLIRNAYTLIGVLSPGESLEPALMTQALTRLNRMIGQWALQSLTIPCVVRELFGLTANVGVYTIGPGGTFDTSRPTSISGAGLLLNSSSTTSTVSSLTRSGTTATATVTTHGRSAGDTVTIAGASPAPYNGTFTITSVPTASTFTYLFAGATTTPATGTITALFESTESDVVEIPMPVITDDARQGIAIKSLTSSLARYVYYNPTFYGGLGTITLWPVPDTTDNTLVLYRPQQLSSFANPTQPYWLPEGSEDAIEYNLAKRLCAPNGVAVPQDVNELAASTLGIYKRANIKLSDVPLDPMWLFGRAHGGYDIITGDYHA